MSERIVRPAGQALDSHGAAAILAAEGEARMERRDVVALCLNILLASTEPIDKTLAYLFRHLADHPEQFAMLRADPSLLAAALAETLRYTPPCISFHGCRSSRSPQPGSTYRPGVFARAGL